MEENKEVKAAGKSENDKAVQDNKGMDNKKKYMILGIAVIGVILVIFIAAKIFTSADAVDAEPAGQAAVYDGPAEAIAAADIGMITERAGETIEEALPPTVEEMEMNLAVMKEKESGYYDSLPQEIKNKKFSTSADKALYFGDLAELYSEKISEGTITEAEMHNFAAVSNLAAIYSMEETVKYLKERQAK